MMLKEMAQWVHENNKACKEPAANGIDCPVCRHLAKQLLILLSIKFNDFAFGRD